MIKLNGNIVKVEKFPNGETKMFTDGLEVDNISNYIELHFENDGDLISLMFLKRHLDEKTTGKNPIIELYLNYIPCSRMDRTEGTSVFTLKYVCEFINNLSFTKVYVSEPHSDVAPALLNNVEIMSPLVFLVRKCTEDINFDVNKDFIYFPDLTAEKRQSKNIKFKNTLSAIKHRDFETGHITGLKIIGDTSKITPESRVIMVDDLTSFGGTFIFGDIELKKLGFKESYLVVAHAEKSALEGKLFNHISKLYTTNSILQEEDFNKIHELKDKIYLLNVDNIGKGTSKIEEHDGEIHWY